MGYGLLTLLLLAIVWIIVAQILYHMERPYGGYPTYQARIGHALRALGIALFIMLLVIVVFSQIARLDR